MPKPTPALLWDIPVALVLLTRLPLPALPAAAFAAQARAGWAFPLAGALVAGIAGAIGMAALALGLSPWIAAGLTLAGQALLTGAMHEDGLADTADGLWGGTTPARRLEIMKDSQIGSYGVLALLLSVGLRWGALTALLPLGPAAFVAAAALSRAPLPLLMTVLSNARGSGLSHSVGRPAPWVPTLALALALALAGVLTGPALLWPALAAALATVALALVARAKIGGQTGDILGAAQQVSETALLIGLSAALTPPF